MSDFSEKYLAGVRRLTKAELDKRARDFITSPSFDPSHRTVVLLPGGLASQLSNVVDIWSEGNLPGDIPTLPPLAPLWLKVETLKRFLDDEAHFLALDENGVERRRSPCVATGALDVVGSPYRKLQRRLGPTPLNYVDFGYDWRRSALSGAEMLKFFLDRLDAIALANGKRSPLPVLLLAHSQGGLVGKVFCELLAAEGEKAVDRYFTHFVPVGAPFLGTINHANRYFTGVAITKKRGQPEFGALKAMRLAKARQGPVTREQAWTAAISEWRTMVASMPGLWHLITPSPKLLDEEFLARRGLARYPLRKADQALDFFADPDLFPWLRQFHTGDAAFRYRADSKLITKIPGAVLKPRVWYVRAQHEVGACELEFTSRSTLEIDPGAPLKSLIRQQVIQTTDKAHDDTTPVWSATLDDDATTTLVGRVEGRKISHRKMVAYRVVIDLLLELAADKQPKPGVIECDLDDDDGDDDDDSDGETDEAGLETWATEYFR